MLEGKTVTVRALQSGSIVELVDETAQGFKNQYADKPPRIGIVERKLPHYKEGETFLVLQGLRGRNFAPLTAAVPLGGKVRVLDGKPRETVLKAFQRYTTKHLGERVAGALGMSIGCDPEIFAVDDKGTLIPAFEYLPDKKKPSLTQDGATYWDGFQAEMAPKATTCLAYHVDHIQACLKEIDQQLKAKFPKGRLTIQNVIEVPGHYLTDGKDEHVILGCDPSENAYGLCGRPVDNCRTLPIRFAGGHIHFGVGKSIADKLPERQRMMEALDAILGVVSVSMAANIDRPVRREYYGLPGEFRLPPHGIEYRTLSNFWLTHPAIAHLTIDLARDVVRLGYAGLNSFIAADMDAVRACIVEHDVPLARKIVRANRNLLESLTSYRYTSKDAGKLAVKVFENGVESVVKDPFDIAGNWRFDKEWIKHSSASGSCWATAVTALTAKSGTLL
jgi:hypothetical protein